MAFREIDIHDFFVNYLLSKGYPKNSITVNPVLENYNRPDFVIVDPETNKPLAIFELKREKTNSFIGKTTTYQICSSDKSSRHPSLCSFSNYC